jgi:hypothetical protein
VLRREITSWVRFHARLESNACFYRNTKAQKSLAKHRQPARSQGEHPESSRKIITKRNEGDEGRLKRARDQIPSRTNEE